MSKGFVTIVGILVGILIALVLFDVIYLILKKNKSLPNNKFTNYMNKRFMQFNSFVLLSVFCFVWLIPLIIGILGSFTSQYAFTYEPGKLIPSDGFTFDNYLAFFNYKDAASGERFPVEKWIFNSLPGS